ncbi:hypothetical protein [Neisseria shayeganii]|uniref:Uncharacterized protein n=1 Tax=Neisseria shayeganii 871 TaxID=1032488 RepID=G4CLJ3_9NEIS|nr:hypothetical protein [Neisseria shayeganii]EGY51312.1 hypothetical protein HMPREF9371_2484 [Neisseria shayeganii 871]
MEIIIKETNTRETLSIIDHKTGCNFIADFIGNTGALDDGQFEWNEEQNAYICNQETFDWWEKVISDNQALENRIAELIEEHGSDAVYKVVADAAYGDLEDHAAIINSELDENFK